MSSWSKAVNNTFLIYITGYANAERQSGMGKEIDACCSLIPERDTDSGSTHASGSFSTFICFFVSANHCI